MYELALFAGAGGGILGGHLNGWRCVGAVECEGYPRGVLAARQNDGCLPAFPIWTDVRTFTKRNNACRRYLRWLRSIRQQLVISGGFPCQDISAAGKGAGINGERSGLWREFARIIREIRPAHVLVENSPILTGRGLDRVLGDLAALGYDADWGVLGACDAGAPHKRERIWIVAHAVRDGARERSGLVRQQAGLAEIGTGRGQWAQSGDGREDVDHAQRFGWESGRGADGSDERIQSGPAGEHGGADAHAQSCGCESQRLGPATSLDQTGHGGATAGLCAVGADSVQHGLQIGLPGQRSGAGPAGEAEQALEGCPGSWWQSEPAVGRVAHGVAHRVDRIKALGNGQVPAVVRLATRIFEL